MRSNMQTTVKLRYRPRWYQYLIHKAFHDGFNRVYALFHRRAGKDICAWNHLIYKATNGIAGLYYYICPTYTQAKKIIWNGIDESGKRILDFIPNQFVKKVNNTEMMIEFVNGSIIQIVGCDNFDSLRGTNPRGVVFSEFAMMDPRVWTEVISPILTKNNGWAFFQTTPMGRNYAFDLWEMALTNKNWYTLKITIDDTQLIAKDLIDAERAEGKDEATIQQEYYCFTEGDVLTSDGVKDISEIKIGDMVLTHSGRFRRVLETYCHEYSDEIYTIHSYGHYKPIICTATHPLRVYNKKDQSYTWVSASKLLMTDQLCYPKLVRFPQVITRSLCRLMALYICEGSCTKTLLHLSVGNKDEVEAVVFLLEELDLKFSVIKRRTGFNIVVNDTGWVDFFRVNCGQDAETKKIPFELIGGHEYVFFEELIRGEGCELITGNDVKYSYSTASLTLAYQVQLLATTLGYTSGITFRKGRNGKIEERNVICKDSYLVQIGVFKNPNGKDRLRISKYNQVANIKSIKSENKIVNVYNIRVEYDESYIINGRSVHNCSFSKGLVGAYYQEIIDTMYRDKRITRVPYDSTVPVHVAFDLGYSDSTAIIYYQLAGREIHLIEAEEYSSKGIQFYAKLLKEKPYVYGKYIFPHDLSVHELGTGTSRAEIFSSLGIEPTILPRDSVQVGIEHARSILLSKVYIDEEKCKGLIKSLSHYHRDYDDKRMVLRSVPVHDFSSHYADAFRYLATSYANNLLESRYNVEDYRTLKRKHRIIV